MTENHTELAVATARGSVDGPTVVALRGEIDLGTATSLTTRLDALTSGPSPDLVLDLRGVTFIDCAGLGVLCRAHNRVRARAGRLRLVSDSARFRRMLRMLDLGGVFEVASRLPDVTSRPLDAATGAWVALR
ncbi:STAS domain-containing protein [Streptomyces sp. NPDC046859]|uniref:STAS domain-containing protein n=1 Tax=Streptomyces sp. NPDC046859 TaxID=3155734 RepID=UPI0033DD0BE8